MPLLQNKPFLAIAFTLFLTACSNSAQRESMEQDQPTTEAKEKPSAEMLSLGQVVDQYLLLKDALVASNAQEAQAKATSMLEVIDATNMMEVQQSAKQIAAATDLETQRAYFDSLSIHVYEHLEGQGEGEKTIYKQYCPMAFDNRGAFWLSNAQEIRNPYFGDQMLKCGRVEETIEY
ncbi:MAG: DUF3347 domain-containing protein [Cyclobacteriaceae bacterium]